MDQTNLSWTISAIPVTARKKENSHHSSTSPNNSRPAHLHGVADVPHLADGIRALEAPKTLLGTLLGVSSGEENKTRVLRIRI
jgi:hypothetical protein